MILSSRLRTRKSPQNENQRSTRSLVNKTAGDLRVNHLILNQAQSPLINHHQETRSLRESKTNNTKAHSKLNKTTAHLRSKNEDDEPRDENDDFVANLKQPHKDDHENVENNLNNKNQQVKRSLRRRLDDKLDATSADEDDQQQRTRKRKLSSTTVDAPKRKSSKKVKDQFEYVFIELQVTGSTSKEEIVKFCVKRNNSNNIAGFTFPKKRMTNRMSAECKIDVGNRIMMYNGQMVKCEEIRELLTEFVEYLESFPAENIVLVYENEFKHDFIPIILINQLRRFDLLERAELKIHGFIDCAHLFKSDSDSGFVLDLSAKEMKITTSLPPTDPCYRLELLQKFFKAKRVTVNDEEEIFSFEDMKQDSEKFRVKRAEEEEQVKGEYDDYTLEQLLEKAKSIVETKECLTYDDLRNLYLLQKFKYQYRNSRTYRPRKKAFPRYEPKKKAAKIKPIRDVSLSVDEKKTDNQENATHSDSQDDVIMLDETEGQDSTVQNTTDQESTVQETTIDQSDDEVMALDSESSH